jgi:hypothetical protein
MIDEIKEDNQKEHREIEEKFEKIESKLDELSKFRWQVGGVVAVAVVLLGIVVPFVDKTFSMPYNGGIQQTQTR